MINDIKRRLRSYLYRHDAVVLTYHSILPEPLPFPIWHNLSTEMFDHHIKILSRDFRCVPVSELMRDLARGRIRPYTVAVTLDDGFRNNLTNALPVLKQYQVPATLFISSGFIGGKSLLWPEWVASILAQSQTQAISFAGQNLTLSSIEDRVAAFRALARIFKQINPADHAKSIELLMNAAKVTRQSVEQGKMFQNFISLTWEEIGFMRESGLFEFGAHTVNHWRLTNLDDEQALRQIVESKLQIEAHLGQVDYFAYPHGGPDDFNATHRQMAIEAGFKGIFTAMSGTVSSRSNCHAIHRCGIGSDSTLDQFTYLLHGGIARNSKTNLT